MMNISMSTYTWVQIGSGLIVLAICYWSYRLAVIMSNTGRDQGIDGTNDRAIRSVKRRVLFRVAKASIVILSAIYMQYWSNLDPVSRDLAAQWIIARRSLGFTVLALLIAVDMLWDVWDRNDATDYELRSRSAAARRRSMITNQPMPEMLKNPMVNSEGSVPPKAPKESA